MRCHRPWFGAFPRNRGPDFDQMFIDSCQRSGFYPFVHGDAVFRVIDSYRESIQKCVRRIRRDILCYDGNIY